MPGELFASDTHNDRTYDARNSISRTSTEVPGVAVVDVQGRVCAWNNTAERLTGWSASEIQGRPLPIANPDHPETVCDALLAGLAAAAPDGFPLSLRDPKSAVHSFHAWASPIADTDRSTVLLLPSDATAPGPPNRSPRLQDVASQMTLFLEENPNPVMRLSRAGDLLYANAAARVLLAAQASEMGGPLTELQDAARQALLHETRREVEVSSAQGRVFSFDCVPFSETGWVNLYGRDITERQDAVDAQRKSEERYRVLFREMTEGFALHEILCDESGVPCNYRFLDINPAFELLTGLKGEDVIGKTVTEVLPDTDPMWIREYGKVALTGEPVHLDEFVPALGRHYDVFAYRPAPGQFAVLFTDVTSLKQAEQALHESVERARIRSEELQAVLDAVPIAIWMAHDPECLQITGNAFADQLMQVHRGDNVSRSATEDMADVTYRVFRDGMELRPEEMPAQVAVATGQPVAATMVELRFHDGRTVYLLEAAVPLFDMEGRVRGALATGADMTAWKQAEEALRESEEKFATAFKASPDAQVISRISDGTIREVNEAFLELFGYRREEVIGRTSLELGMFANPAQREHAIDQVRQTGSLRDYELRIRLRSGEERDASLTVEAMQMGGEAVMLTVTRDITEQKRIGQALREASERLRYHVENSPLAVVEFDAGLHITRWSQEAERVFGWTADEVMGKGMWEIPFIHPDDVQSVEAISKAMTSGEKPRNVHPNRNVRKDGKVIWCVWYNSALLGENGDLVSILSLVLDVTEREEAQEEQRHLFAELQTERENLQRALQELAESREQYRIMGETIPYGVWRCNPRGGTEYTSQSFLDLLEMTMDEVREFGWTHRLPPDEVQPMLDKWLHCCETGEPWDSEHHVLGPDGEYHTVLTRGLPVRNDQGEITSWVGINLDIDDRKRMEEAVRESEARFRTLADNISQLTWMTDAEGWITWYNQRWFDFTGTTLEDMQGWGWKAVHHPDHIDRVVERWSQHIETGEPWEDVFPLRGADGEYRWFLSRAFSVRDETGKVARWFGTNTDITEQREMEEELRRRAEKLAIADRAKDDFLAMLAHELRNPLGSIGNAAALIEMHVEGNPRLRKPVEILNRQVRHTARLVDDLLDVSRITCGKMELQKGLVELTAIVQRATETTGPQMDAYRHEFTVSVSPAPLWLEGDTARLEQVVGNLLNNAVKYTDPGGHIALSVVREGIDAVIRVTDDGQGISEEMLPRVFDLFAQEDRSLARSKGGLGIGLTLVKNLVEMHGGNVEAHSEGPGRGSRFVVRLPLLYAGEYEQREQADTMEATGKRRILIVEDNVDAATALGEILVAWGHEVVVVHDGPAALEAAAQHSPDVVLLDIGLPGMDGYEIARALRREQATAACCLIALTGYGQETDQRRSREAGFDWHLVKPVDMAALKTALADGANTRGQDV